LHIIYSITARSGIVSKTKTSGKMPSGVVTLAFHSMFIGERDSRRASTGEPRDRFGDIGWCPQLFDSFNLYFLISTTTSSTHIHHLIFRQVRVS